MSSGRSPSAADVVGEALNDIDTFVCALLHITSPQINLDPTRQTTEEEHAKQQELVQYFISKAKDHPHAILEDPEISTLLHTVNTKLNQVELLVQNHQLPLVERTTQLRQGLEILSQLRTQYLQHVQSQNHLLNYQQQNAQLPQQQIVQHKQPIQPRQSPQKKPKQQEQYQYANRLQQQKAHQQKQQQKDLQKRQTSPNPHTALNSQSTTSPPQQTTSTDTPKEDDNAPEDVPPASNVPPTPSPSPNFAFGSLRKPTTPTLQTKPTPNNTKVHATISPAPAIITTQSSRPSYPSPKSSRTPAPRSPPTHQNSPPDSPSQDRTQVEPSPLNSPLIQELTHQNNELQNTLRSLQENVAILQSEKDQAYHHNLQLTQQLKDLQIQYFKLQQNDSSDATIAALQQQCTTLHENLSAHHAQANVDNQELLHTIHLLETMNDELGQHNYLWRSAHHALVTPDPTRSFPDFSSEPIPDIAEFVDKGILAQVFQLRGALHESEESNKVSATIIKTLQQENVDVSKQETSTLRRECTALAASLTTLESTNKALHKELLEVRNEEAHTFELLHASLENTKQACEHKMRKYEDDLTSLLASWTQQQTQLDTWVHTITAQQQELQATQAQLAQANEAAQKAEDAWRKERVQLLTQRTQGSAPIAGVSAGAHGDALIREAELASEDAVKLRERIQRQNLVIEELNSELKRLKEALYKERDAKSRLETQLSSANQKGGLLEDELSRARTQANDMELRVLGRLVSVGDNALNSSDLIDQMRDENAQQHRELEHLRHTHSLIVHQFHALREGWVDFLRQLGFTTAPLPSFSFPSPATYPLQQPPTFTPPPPPATLEIPQQLPSTPPSLLVKSPSSRYANLEDRDLFNDSPPPVRARAASTIIPHSSTPLVYPREEATSGSSNELLASLRDIEDKLTQIKLAGKHSDFTLSPSPSNSSIPPTSSSIYPTSVPYSTLYPSLSFSDSVFATPRARLNVLDEPSSRLTKSDAKLDGKTYSRVHKSGEATHMLLDEVEQMEKMMKRWSSLDADDFGLEGLEREDERRWAEREMEWRREERRGNRKVSPMKERDKREKLSRDKRSSEKEKLKTTRSKDKGRDEPSRDKRESKSRSTKELDRNSRRSKESRDKDKEKDRDRGRDRDRDRDRNRDWDRHRDKDRDRDRDSMARDRENNKDVDLDLELEMELERLERRNSVHKANYYNGYDNREHEKASSSDDGVIIGHWKRPSSDEDMRNEQRHEYEDEDEEEEEIQHRHQETEYDSHSSYSSDQPNVISPPPPPPKLKLQKPSSKRPVREKEEKKLSPRSMLPHLLQEIKSRALRSSEDRAGAIAAIEAQRRSGARRLRASDTQLDLMEQIKALRPNSGARLTAIQNAEMQRTGLIEAKRKEFLDSFARRKLLLRQTEGGLGKIEEMRKLRDEEVRLSIAQEYALRTSLTSPPSTRTTPRTTSDDSVPTSEAMADSSGGSRADGVSEASLEELLEDEQQLLEGEGLLELGDDEIAALERELGEPQNILVTT